MLGLLQILVFLLTTLTVLSTALLSLTVSEQPLSSSHLRLEQDDVSRAREILESPSTADAAHKTIALNQNDLNIASNYLLNHLIRSSSTIRLNRDSLDFLITLTLPDNVFGRYINIGFQLRKEDKRPAVTALKVGDLAVPDAFAGQLITGIIRFSPLQQYYVLAAQHISHIEIQPERLLISYWSVLAEDAEEEPPSLKTPDSRSLAFYQQQINQIIQNHDPDWRLSLAEVMQPLFLSAYQRSDDASAIDENRAVIIAVSSYVNKKELNSYVPIKLTPGRHYPVYLYKRRDMAKHFVGSAALAAAGATTLAQVIGQEKELIDAKQQGGSGFSFIDLASDRAGLKFGQTATDSSTSARKLQKAMSQVRHYREFMPEVLDLPEQMPLHVFEQQFSSLDSPTYQDMLRTIDERIEALPIYQN